MSPEAPTPPTRRFAGMDLLVAEVLQDIEARGEQPELSTGLPELDKAIWGVHRGEVMVIAARPGEGKTSMALQIAGHLVDQRKKVLFVSFEMSVHQLVERWLIQLTQTPAWELRTGQGAQRFKEKLAPLNGFFKEVNLRCIDDYGDTVSELTHLFYTLAEAGRIPDLLILDFIQLIESDEEEPIQEVQAIKHYLRTLKKLAVRYHCAVIVCSQINREGGRTKGKNRPRLIHLKGSGSIEELSDTVLMLWWQELGTEEKPEGTNYWICVEKQRYGAPGQLISVRFDAERITFQSGTNTPPDWHEEAEPVAE